MEPEGRTTAGGGRASRIRAREAAADAEVGTGGAGGDQGDGGAGEPRRRAGGRAAERGGRRATLGGDVRAAGRRGAEEVGAGRR